MALSWADLGTIYTSGTTPSLTFNFTPVSGEKIVVVIATRETTQTMTTPPSGYTLRESYTGGSNFNAWLYEKTSDGTETSVGFTLGANSNLRISAIVLQGPSSSTSLQYDDSDSDPTNVGTATTSGGFGSVTTTEDDAGVAAILVMDQSWGGTDPTVSGYTNTNNDPVGSTHGGIDMFTKVLSSTGTETPTWSGSGDTDQNWGAIIAFKDVLSGGSIESGAGSAAGSSTAIGAGAAIAAGTGSAAGSATAPGVGASTAEGTGTASGTSTASGVGSTGGSVEEGAGSASGSSTATGVGASIAAGEGDADGSSQASGAGAATAAGTGSAAGSSEATGVGSTGGSVEEGAGSASGSSEATGAGASTAAGAGSSAGSSVASGVSADSRALIGTVTSTPTLLATVISIGKYTGSVLSAPAFTHDGITSEAA